MTNKDFSRFCRLLYDRHLVTGVGGNLSVRVGKRFLVTPSGYSLRDVTPENVVVVDEGGRTLRGGTPTKDLGMHLLIMACRRDVNAVCHAHGSYLIALSTLLKPGPDVLPPLTPGSVYLAHPLPMLPYMTPGSRALFEAGAKCFRDQACSAVLLQNHGLVTVGKSLQDALNVAEEIDEAARIYLLTRGKAHRIPADGVAAIKRLR
ncbi:MAG: class II aldolase/adducin family protein [Deltaproteobacteria bacterium]|nr:class II aldolase/adducin family protein [Deltaproteobacteria bacterium]